MNSLLRNACLVIGWLHAAIGLAASPSPEGNATGAAPRAVSFARDIQPLLAERCLLCHGPDESEAGLRLDQAEHATEQLASGQVAIRAGEPEQSELLRRVTTDDPNERMPPEGEPLTPEQIDLLRDWIRDGAAYERHWAFRPVSLPAVPEVSRPDWCVGGIDRFVLARLDATNIQPSPPKERESLIRRLYADLIGLPPEIEVVDQFLADDSPEAYERIVDRLLRSEHFGERWGRHWLDMARYADSDGYEKDNPRPNAWRYRDWVINAINRDLPLDQFAIEQLAGDLLDEPTPMQRLATAFHRQTLTNTEGGVDQEEFRVEATFDRTETTAAVWMALTMNCARCHSHKYDAISHRDYYQLFAVFNNVGETDFEVPRSDEELQRFEVAQAQYAAELADLESRYAKRISELQPQIARWEQEHAARIAAATEPLTEHDPLRSLPAEVAAALRVAPAERSAEQVRQIADHVATQDAAAAELAKQLTALKAKAPPSPLIRAAVIQAVPRATRRFERGDFLQPAEEIVPSAPEVIQQVHPLVARVAGQPPDRLDLARWLVDPNHPLTARVMVNQIWQRLFGQGLVPTLSDFGVRGEPPTHPELLDWLAWRLPRELGWSRKALIKEIVMSGTYRQASRHRPELGDLDPTNRLLARQNRVRVEAEIVRDLVLATSGLLDRTVGGPSVFPPLPPGVAELSYANNFKWTLSGGGDRYRRGMYTFFKRTSPHPTLITFDCPDSNTSQLSREISNTPLQALTLLNNVVFTEAAVALAARVLREAAGDDAARREFAFRLCLTRLPDEEEHHRFATLLASARSHYQNDPEAAKRLIATGSPDTAPGDQPLDAAEHAAWASTLRILINLDEFIVRE